VYDASTRNREWSLIVARKVFYSFHYIPDGWRTAQIRNAGVVEGNRPVSDNDWETITKAGDQAIKNWINDQLHGKSCAVVLIGSGTAGRKWINYEIEQAWNANKGVVGVYIHNLKNRQGLTSTKGANPFSNFTICSGKTKLSNVVNAYNVNSTDSQVVYRSITSNLEAWVDEANEIRRTFRC
jgi:antiphage defense system Thoeris ThsB-like protein